MGDEHRWLRRVPDVHPGPYQPYLWSDRVKRRERQLLRAMVKYPPGRWNKRIREAYKLIENYEQYQKTYWEQVEAYNRTWGPVYAKFGRRVAKADAEIDSRLKRIKRKNGR